MMPSLKKPQTVQVVRLVVVSPSDVQFERDAVSSIVDELNDDIASTLGITLAVAKWETDAYPGFHLAGPQGLIDDVLRIEESDIVIGIFWTRFGTPTRDADSGTEYELRKAVKAWEENKKPQVMVYFNKTPYNPKRHEMDQWAKVLAFQDSFSENGLWWNYQDRSAFEKLVRKHLIKLLNQTFGRPAAATENVDVDRIPSDIPHFANQVLRPSLLATLNKEIGTNSVVAIEGLPGSGKTHLVASFFEQRDKQGDGRVFWHDPQEGRVIDDFLARISLEIPLSGLSTVSKCKELVKSLNARNITVVIDDFQEVDSPSFSNLVNAAVRSGGPARLVLISRTYVDLIRDFSEIGHIVVSGFNVEEMKAFLSKREVKGLSRGTIEALISKTDGLPLAASLFATLVRNFNRDPRDLLKDAILNHQRLQMWFSEVSSLITNIERKLLTSLSVCDGPFNMSAVRSLGKQQGLSDVDQSFESLQRSYLVQRYSPYRWNIHQLIAMFCTSALTEGDKKGIHRALGNYYLKGLRQRRGTRSLLLTETDFAWKVRACRQFQLAGEHSRSEAIVHEISKTAKTRGYYETLIHLTWYEMRSNAQRNVWINYHHAHCCLITGKLGRGLDAVEPLVYQATDISSEERLSFTRLYAEIIGSMGKPDVALDQLREAIRSVSKESIRRNILSQARSVEAWLLTLLRRYLEAEQLTKANLDDSVLRGDELGKAVSLTRLGIIFVLSGYPETAQEKLIQARGIFRELEDRRGLAWTLSYLALSNVELDNKEVALEQLRQAMGIEFDIGGCSMDYLSVLKLIKSKLDNRKTVGVINRELERVGAMLGDVAKSSLFRS
jgi:tetratricopeptide (TPR) repeat protein